MPNIKHLVILIIGWKLLSSVWFLVAPRLFELKPFFTAKSTEYGEDLPAWLAWGGNFDGIHYMGIAEEGYVLGEQPFFPLLPLGMAVIHAVSGLGYLESGLIISHLSFIGCFWVIWKLVKLDVKKQSVSFYWWLLFFWLSFPTSFFYGAVYNDSLFLLFACLCLLEGRQKNYLWAGVWGALATLSRLNGIALFIYLVIEYATEQKHAGQLLRLTEWKKIWQKRLSLPPLWQSRIWLSALIPLALIGYLAYIQVTAGDFRLLFSSMKTWNQDQVTFPLIVVWRYFRIFLTTPVTSTVYLVAVLEFLAVTLYCGVLLATWRKIRFSYWMFMLSSILIPWLTGTFAGMPRYALHLYPFFFSVALLLHQKPWWVNAIVILLSLSLQCLIFSLFNQGYFVT